MCTAIATTLSKSYAQEFNDELKKKLRQSLDVPDRQPPHRHQAINITPKENQEVLKVSPTTKLPTKFDRIELLEPIPPEQRVHIELEVTNIDTKSQLARSAINYSNGRVHAIPDARSISQSAQYTRNDYGVGFYADEDSPDWLRKLRNKHTPQYRDIDLDPVRYFQRLKAKKRKEQVDRIKKVYE